MLSQLRSRTAAAAAAAAAAATSTSTAPAPAAAAALPYHRARQQQQQPAAGSRQLLQTWRLFVCTRDTSRGMAGQGQEDGPHTGTRQSPPWMSLRLV